jgi:chaperone modulatory protein CbpM
MRRINDVLKEINHSIDQPVLEDFIARGWVLPVRDETDYIFDEIDVSRIHLICELHIDMKFEFDAVDVILSLMDQLYESRSRFIKITKALENQSDDVHMAVLESLTENSDPL